MRLDLCKRAIKATTNAGAEEVEALLINRRSINVEIQRAEIKTAANIKDVASGDAVVRPAGNLYPLAAVADRAPGDQVAGAAFDPNRLPSTRLKRDSAHNDVRSALDVNQRRRAPDTDGSCRVERFRGPEEEPL